MDRGFFVQCETLAISYLPYVHSLLFYCDYLLSIELTLTVLATTIDATATL